MKVLFVSSGNSTFGISPIVYEQGEALRKTGIDIEYYAIQGKGIVRYLKNVILLRKHLRAKRYDLVHSHYVFSSIVALLSHPPKIVVSLMGSDLYISKLLNTIIRLCVQYAWDATIVKSAEMKRLLKLKRVQIIPNGVDLTKFYPILKQKARESIGWSNSTHILFASDPNRKEKDYSLAASAIEQLSQKDITTKLLKDVSHAQMVYYLNSADILLLTSKYEGSPNIVKEAMACNIPIVATDVGDIRWVLGETVGCYLTKRNAHDVAYAIAKALEFSQTNSGTDGRKRIVDLGLDSDTISSKICNLYFSMVNSKESMLKQHKSKQYF